MPLFEFPMIPPEKRPNDPIDARFGPMLAEIDVVTERHGLLAGESIYLLTLLLLGCIQDAPADVRELFRGASVQALLGERGSGHVLEQLCLDGKMPR
jgi:hypothetical protein